MARGDDFRAPKLEPPASIEAEQALLGALLFDGGAEHPIGASLVPAGLAAGHFYEPFHQRIFARWEAACRDGRRFDWIIAGAALASDPAFPDMGGQGYFFGLFDRAPPPPNAKDYAATIIDLATKRRLLSLADEIRAEVQADERTGEELAGDVAVALTSIATSSSEIGVTSADQALDDVIEYVDNPGRHASGILTGLAPVDDHLGPWLPGDLIALAGRPGQGKSAEAGIIDMNVAREGVGVMEIHAEMTVQQAWRRRLTAAAYSLYAEEAPKYAAIRKRTLTFDQRQMLEKARELLRGIPLVAIKRTGMTLAQLWALVARQKLAWERQGIPFGLLTIDHAGLIMSGKDYRSRVDEQTAVSNGLKEGADRHQIAVQALLQLNRQVESRDEKRPQLQDLRDSGSWEQDADIVIGSYRAAYYAMREREPDQTTSKGKLDWADWNERVNSPWIENIFLKVREGEPGTAKVWADMGTNTILGAAPAINFFGGL